MAYKKAPKHKAGKEGAGDTSGGNAGFGARKPLRATPSPTQSDVAMLADSRREIAHLFINHESVFSAEEFRALGKGDRGLLLDIMCARLMALSGELQRNGFHQAAQSTVEKWKAFGLAIDSTKEIALFYEFKDEADRLLDITGKAKATLENDKFMKVAIFMVNHYVTNSLNLKYSDDGKGRQRADDTLLIIDSYLRCASDRKFARYLVEAMLAENLYGELVARIREYK